VVPTCCLTAGRAAVLNLQGDLLRSAEYRRPRRGAQKLAKAESPPQLSRWTIYKLAASQAWIGEVETSTEAVEKAAAEFKQYAPKLMAVRRSAIIVKEAIRVCEPCCSTAGSSAP
jgi:hypothetical protein